MGPAPVAQATPKASMPDATAAAAGAQKVPTLDVVITRRPLLLLHQLPLPRLLPPSWIVLPPSWTGCEKISRAPTPAWWPGAWSWPLAGSALMPPFERRWSRP